MAGQMCRMTITPGENGGHSVEHEFKPKASKGSGGMIGYDRPPSEMHHFGPGDGHKMMEHITSALKIKEAKEEKAE